MREILFRGKRTDNGDWEYGDLWCNPYGKRIVCIVSPINDQGTTGGNEVDPETIGQYTGLKDKNGKKIFEGDIVCHDFGKKQIGKQYAIVKWSEKYASFQLNPIDNWMFCNLSDVNVVGNIYDNPESEVTND